MGIRCSVIVPTYRRPQLLERCLRGLSLQSLDSDQYEIIVCDDAASLETEKQIRDLATQIRCRVTYVAVEGAHGPAAARNAGSEFAAGEILAFTDDDCCPDRNWIAAGLSVFSNSTVDAAWGKLVMPLSDSPTDYELDASHLAEAIFVTANCYCRKSVFQTVGGFDPQFTAAWREDSDLYFTLLERGHLVVACPDAVVTHPIRPASWGVSLAQQRKSLFDVLLARKHPELYRQFVPPFPASYVIAVMAILAVGIGAIMRIPLLCWLAFFCWLVVTIRFCIRRLRHTSKRPSHVSEMVLTSVIIPPLAVFWRLVGFWKFSFIKQTFSTKPEPSLRNA